MVNFSSAFVTGATGLLGNNLVRALVKQNVRVTSLVRSLEKARKQFADIPEIAFVVGDMASVPAFADRLQGHDIVFHTAAYFRDNYKGGVHTDKLLAINVNGTRTLLQAAWDKGIRRFVHTSSIAVLYGRHGSPTDETCLRDEHNADDYYRSKILSDREVIHFLRDHQDFHAVMVLPGWMHGPGDWGPTSAGQVVQDFIRQKIPGIIQSTFSIVDARDVAQAEILAAEKGRSGERYLAAGRNMSMTELFSLLEKISGVKAPAKKLPFPVLFGIAALQEIYSRLTNRPILLSLASVRLMKSEQGRTKFDHKKSENELGLTFRPTSETLTDEIAWLRSVGLL